MSHIVSQPHSGECIPHPTVNRADIARLDVKSRRFWITLHQWMHFDARTFKTNLKSCHHATSDMRENNAEYTNIGIIEATIDCSFHWC